MVAVTTAATEDVLRRPSAFRRLMRRKGAVVGLCVVSIFVLIAILAPWLAPYDPIATNFLQVRKPPSAEHWMGTDEIGRDLMSRLIYGARASLQAGVISVMIAVCFGVPLGLLSGYCKGWVDSLMMRIVDAFLACPFLILAIAMAAFLGPSLTNAMIAIGLTAMPIFVRLVRGQVLAVTVEDYVEAARALGNPHVRIAVRHVLPNIVAPVLVQSTLAIAQATLAEAALSFLGLGLQPPVISWGVLLREAQNIRSIATAPWLFAPGAAVVLAVLALNFLGDGLRDAADPYNK